MVSIYYYFKYLKGNLFSFNDIFTNFIREREENNIINEICPNPDEMTYEQLLELQEKIGYVSKGLSEEDKKVITFFNRIRKFL